MRYSFVIPVYNRPDEVRELLESLTHQELFDFEIVIIEDGSSVSSEAIVESYRGSFPALRYIAVPNGGPSRARNLGAREATGEYLIILDSDVVLPPGYLTAVDDYLEKHPVDASAGLMLHRTTLHGAEGYQLCDDLSPDDWGNPWWKR